MLADSIVAVALGGIAKGHSVLLETDGVQATEIAQIEHVGSGLLRYRYTGPPNDHFVSETRIKSLVVRPPESEW
jgi:hypothetical protein